MISTSVTNNKHIVKQDQIITTTSAKKTPNNTKYLNNNSTEHILSTFKRYFTNCFQTSSAVVIDYSSTATSVLTPKKSSKKRPRTTTTTTTTKVTVPRSTHEINMMLNNSNTTSQNPYAGSNTSSKKKAASMMMMDSRKRCESPRITKRKMFLPNIAKNTANLSAAPLPCYDNYPSVCGKYSLEKSLQNGYSGKVFQGHYLKHDQQTPVVVKCCKKLSSWNTETRALERLNHPNIIKLVGTPEANVPATDYTSSIGSSNATTNENQQRNRHLTPDSSPQRSSNLPLIHVLAQELASNGDLYELLQGHGSFNETIARTIIKPVVEGLLYAYETNGVSHRDIKLENIFVAEDGTIKIGDWGLSGFDTKERYCSSSCGTLGYMAPEMVCREKYDANKTDVWAIAVVLFSLCTGVRPYSEPKSRRKNLNDMSWRDEWLGAMMSGKWKLWWMSHARTTPLIKNMSSELCDLFERMFHGDMDQRASLFEVLDHEWMAGPTCSKQQIVNLCRTNRRRNSK
jgi:serine/threonine protein kinase